jgi:hypothetical protein
MNDLLHTPYLMSGGGDQAPLNDLDEAEHEVDSDGLGLDDGSLNDLLSETDEIESDPNVP